MSIYEKGQRFNNSKPGIIIGFVFAFITMAIGIFCLIRTIEKKETLAIIGSIGMIALSIVAIITESNRAKKLKS